MLNSTSRILVLTTFIIINVFHVKTTDLRESLDFPYSQNFNDEEKVSTSGLLIDYNITKLDTKDDANSTKTGWKISRFPTSSPKWFSYYINTLQFTGNSQNNMSCASVFVNATSELSSVNGIWTACQDPVLPEDCRDYDGLACHPFLKYDDGRSGQVGRIRTIKLNVALYGFGILRFWAGAVGPNTKCFDYSVRQDPFSLCEFRQSKPAQEISGGWQEIVYTSEKDTFNRFQIDMIARFKQDMILLDKIEASEERLCDYENCTTPPPTTPTTKNTKTTSRESSATSPLTTSTTSISTSETSSTSLTSSSPSTLVTPTSGDPSQTSPITETATGTIPDVTVNTSSTPESTSEDLLTTTTKANPNVASSMLYQKTTFLYSLVPLCLMFL